MFVHSFTLPPFFVFVVGKNSRMMKTNFLCGLMRTGFGGSPQVFLLRGAPVTSSLQTRINLYSSVSENHMALPLVTERVMRIVREFHEVKEPDSVTSDTHFENDLKFDSLAHTELIMHIEDEFNIDIPEEDMKQIKTVGDLISYFVAHPTAK